MTFVVWDLFLLFVLWPNSQNIELGLLRSLALPSGFSYIHGAVHPSPLSNSRMLHLPRKKTHTLYLQPPSGAFNEGLLGERAEQFHADPKGLGSRPGQPHRGRTKRTSPNSEAASETRHHTGTITLPKEGWRTKNGSLIQNWESPSEDINM